MEWHVKHYFIISAIFGNRQYWTRRKKLILAKELTFCVGFSVGDDDGGAVGPAVGVVVGPALGGVVGNAVGLWVGF